MNIRLLGHLRTSDLYILIFVISLVEFFVEMKQSSRNAGMHTNKLDDNIIQCHDMSVK